MEKEKTEEVKEEEVKEEEVKVEESTTNCENCGNIIYKYELCSCQKNNDDKFKTK